MKENSNFKPETLAVTAGRTPHAFEGAVNPPVFHASTLLFATLEQYDAAEKANYSGYSYGRYGTPTTATLEKAIAALEGASRSFITSSGVAAFVLALQSFLSAGDHLLMVDTVYGPCRRYCDLELKRFGIETTYYDPLIGAGIAALIRPNTKAVYLESPGSLTFEVQDVPAIAKAAHAKGCIVIADSTWATPMLWRPFELGVDISLHSATKYIAGHSDLIMGAVSAVKSEHVAALLRCWRNTGACAGPDDVYLAQRGLRTMGVRLKRHEETGLILADWLSKRPEVKAVLHPAHPSHPQHAIWKRDCLGASGLFSILIEPCSRSALAAMLDHMELFGMGYSWGGYESLMIPFDPSKTRTAKPWNHQEQPLRIHAGLEDPDDLIRDLEAGFNRLKAAA